MANRAIIIVRNINIAVVDANLTELHGTTSNYARTRPRKPKKAIYSKHTQQQVHHLLKTTLNWFLA